MRRSRKEVELQQSVNKLLHHSPQEARFIASMLELEIATLLSPPEDALRQHRFKNQRS